MRQLPDKQAVVLLRALVESRIIRLPVNVVDNIARVGNARRKLGEKPGRSRPVSDEEIANALGEYFASSTSAVICRGYLLSLGQCRGHSLIWQQQGMDLSCAAAVDFSWILVWCPLHSSCVHSQ